MSTVEGLRKMALETEAGSGHRGYWYCISDALVLMVCGMLCSLQTIEDIYEWSKAEPVRAFLKEQFSIEKFPCRAQFYNILGCVDAEQFSLSFMKWMQAMLQDGVAGRTIAIDGKSICSTGKLSKEGSMLHIVSTIVSECGMVIGSRDCGTNGSEVMAFRELIELLDVADAVVVADALHCKKQSAKAVVEAGADYLFSVKANNPDLRENIALYFQEEQAESIAKTEKNGGRIETRTGFVSRDIAWLHGREDWTNLTCIGAIHAEFEKDGKKSSAWHYYISSAPLTAESLLKHARLEWGVEAMHWLLDVHFAEDKTRVWDTNVQNTLNIARKTVLNLVKNFKSKTKSNLAISKILKRNLFDLNNFSEFLETLRVN